MQKWINQQQGNKVLREHNVDLPLVLLFEGNVATRPSDFASNSFQYFNL